MFLMWFDDSPKHSQEQKIREAAARYAERFGTPPTVALVAPSEVVSVEGLVVKGSAYVGRNNIWVGRE